MAVRSTGSSGSLKSEIDWIPSVRKDDSSEDKPRIYCCGESFNTSLSFIQTMSGSLANLKFKYKSQNKYKDFTSEKRKNFIRIVFI